MITEEEKYEKIRRDIVKIIAKHSPELLAQNSDRCLAMNIFMRATTRSDECRFCFFRVPTSNPDLYREHHEKVYIYDIYYLNSVVESPEFSQHLLMLIDEYLRADKINEDISNWSNRYKVLLNRSVKDAIYGPVFIHFNLTNHELATLLELDEKTQQLKHETTEIYCP